MEFERRRVDSREWKAEEWTVESGVWKVKSEQLRVEGEE